MRAAVVRMPASTPHCDCLIITSLVKQDSLSVLWRSIVECYSTDYTPVRVGHLACVQIRLVSPADGQISNYLWNFSKSFQSPSRADDYFVTV